MALGLKVHLEGVCLAKKSWSQLGDNRLCLATKSAASLFKARVDLLVIDVLARSKIVLIDLWLKAAWSGDRLVVWNWR